MKLKNLFAIATLFISTYGVGFADEIQPMQSMKSETQRDREVEESLIKAFSLKRGEDVVYYYYNKVDLNGDSKPEVIVYAYGPMLGGSGGDSGLVLKEISEGYQIISKFSLMHTPVIVSDEASHGWKDIILDVFGGGIVPGKAVMKFDGKKYPSNPSVQPLVSNGYPFKGIKILDDDANVNPGIRLD